jgi:response regulator RpfG family c-di-GMP phosphodiesterase
MTASRSYRSALSHDEALAEMTRAAGTQFDPRLAKRLLAMVASPESRLDPAADRDEHGGPGAAWVALGEFGPERA